MPFVFFMAVVLPLGAVVVAGFGILLLGVLAAGGTGWGLYALYQWDKKNRVADAAAQAQQQRLTSVRELAEKPIPSPEEFGLEFVDALSRAIAEEGLQLPPRHIFEHMVNAAVALYAEGLPPSVEEPDNEFHLQFVAERRQKFDPAIIAAALVGSFVEFVRRMPRVMDGPLKVQLRSVVPLTETVAAMSRFFWHDELATPDLLPTLRNIQRLAACERLGTDKKPVWASQYFEPDVHRQFLPRELADLFEYAVPFGQSLSDRAMHHYLLGATGSGKTTFLSHLIWKDIEAAAQGKCSVVVLDSQVRLIEQISRLKVFAPGQPLHKKLIVIDPETPLAVNPFAMEDDIEGTIDLIMKAVSTSGELSPHQSGPLRYFIRAAATVPNATLATLGKIAKPEERLRLCDHWGSDAKLVDFFEYGIKHVFPQTLSSIVARLSTFSEDPVIERLFSNPECRLDLLSKLQEGCVVLIDAKETKLSEARREVFGRVFLAMLNRVAQRRADQQEHRLKPVWTYIDEAHSYIGQDKSIGDMLLHARKKRIGLTLALHSKTYKIDREVVGVLENDCYTRTQCHVRGRSTMEVGHGQATRAYDIPVEEFISPIPPMSDTEYAQVRREIIEEYGPRGPKSLPPPPTRPQLVESHEGE